MGLLKQNKCINCVFLSKNLLRGKNLVDENEREIIEHDLKEGFGWGDNQYFLECYHNYWSEGSSSKQDIYQTVCLKDRSDCPSYLEYDPNYKTFPSAVKTLEGEIERKKTRNKYLFRTFIAFLTVSLALVGGIFAEELKELIINLYDMLVQYLD